MFSIVIPVYNSAQYLSSSIGSLLAQTNTDWEAICIDDGSTDGSGDILDRFAENDRRIRVIHQKNSGVSSARNAGIDQSEGNHIIFLDADDAFVPWALSTIDNAIKSVPDADFYVFKAQNVKEMSDTLPPFPHTSPTLDCLDIVDERSAQTAYSKLYGTLLAWGACHKRLFLEGIRFAPFPNGEDELFGYECITHAKEIVFIDSDLYRYRISRTGSASAPSLRKLKSCCDNIVEWHRITNGWRYREALPRITRRKWRVRLCGVMYPILRALDVQGRKEGQSMFLTFLKQELHNSPENFTLWTRFWILVATKCKTLLPFALFVFLPFKCQVMLLKIPFVQKASIWLKGIRDRCGS